MQHDLNHWLSQTLVLEASDLHLSAGLPPMVRVHGELQTLPSPALTAPQLENILRQALPFWAGTESPLHAAPSWIQDHDTAIDWPGLGRFRVNVFAQSPAGPRCGGSSRSKCRAWTPSVRQHV